MYILKVRGDTVPGGLASNQAPRLEGGGVSRGEDWPCDIGSRRVVIKNVIECIYCNTYSSHHYLTAVSSSSS
jgi:hypothetical protein